MLYPGLLLLSSSSIHPFPSSLVPNSDGGRGGRGEDEEGDEEEGDDGSGRLHLIFKNGEEDEEEREEFSPLSFLYGKLHVKKATNFG